MYNTVQADGNCKVELFMLFKVELICVKLVLSALTDCGINTESFILDMFF